MQSLILGSCQAGPHCINNFEHALLTPHSICCRAAIGSENEDGSKKFVIRPYTPTSPKDAKGYFDLVVKVYEQGKMSKHFGELKVHTFHYGTCKMFEQNTCAIVCCCTNASVSQLVFWIISDNLCKHCEAKPVILPSNLNCTRAAKLKKIACMRQ